MSTDRLIEAVELTKRFPGVLALDKVNFELKRGSVHAVCGENGAGKSTLMNLLMGVYQRDSGEIKVNGQLVNFQMPRQAIASGITIIEQELNPVWEMSIAENIFLGRELTYMGFWINYKDLEREARKILEEVGLFIDPSIKIKRLSLAQVQLVEIAKAISCKSDIIIMDEPTSAIGEKDAEILFGIIEKLKAEGKGIVYISHRLKEIFTISDTITVLRDGKFISTQPTSDITRSELVKLMIGRKLEEEFVKTNTPTSEPVLEVNKLGRSGYFKDISLKVHRGEILGIFGIRGSGRSEFFDSIFGVQPANEGEIIVEGIRKKHLRPNQAIRSGLALVTEDRKLSGLVLQGSILSNVSLPILKRLSRFGIINKQQEFHNVKEITDRFRVRTPNLKQLVRRLSGGNQQKVVLAKWLLTKPKVLLLDEPTRGIDVGAKMEIYAFMSEFANQGNAVIMISSEIPEIMGMSDRITVFHNGRKIHDKHRTEMSQVDLMVVEPTAYKQGAKK